MWSVLRAVSHNFWNCSRSFIFIRVRCCRAHVSLARRQDFPLFQTQQISKSAETDLAATAFCKIQTQEVAAIRGVRLDEGCISKKIFPASEWIRSSKTSGISAITRWLSRNLSCRAALMQGFHFVKVQGFMEQARTASAVQQNNVYLAQAVR